MKVNWRGEWSKRGGGKNGMRNGEVESGIGVWIKDVRNWVNVGEEGGRRRRKGGKCR